MPLSNYHTHIYLCKHATGTIDDYVKKAISNHYEVIGISDHGPISDDLTKLLHSRRMSESEFLNIYLKDILDAKSKYSKQITVLGALEIEFYDKYITRLLKLREEVDYLILGQHELLINDQFISVYKHNKTKEDIINYQETVCIALNTKLFKILAHPDLFMYNYPVFDDVCKEASLKIIETAYLNDCALEINANGIRKAYKEHQVFDEQLYMFPNSYFWDLVSDFQRKHPNLKVIINDDSHSPSDFCDLCTREAESFAIRHNIVITPKL